MVCRMTRSSLFEIPMLKSTKVGMAATLIASIASAALALAVYFRTRSDEADKVVVETPFGAVKGERVLSAGGVAYDAFLAIPYAEPPERFQRTVSKQSWTVEWDATYTRDGCVASQGEILAKDTSEDCLFLKIPMDFDENQGGFAGGSSIDQDVDALADNFVSKGLIIVQPSYRVGAFGWLSAGPNSTTNFGAWDVLEALNFTRQIISSFGGNTEEVTLMGQGAGAVLTSLLTLSPAVPEGWFRRAVQMSGSMLMPEVDTLPEETVRRNQDFVKAAECDDDAHSSWSSGAFDDILSCLRGKSAEELVRAQAEAGMDSPMRWHPVIDGPDGLLPKRPDELVKTRRNISTLIGTSRDETAWDLFVRPTAFAQDFRHQSPPNFDQLNNVSQIAVQCTKLVTAANFRSLAPVRKACAEHFSKGPAPKADPDPLYWWRRVVAVGSSFRYHEPVARDARAQLEAGNERVYLYSMDYVRDASGASSGWWRRGGAFRGLDAALLTRAPVGGAGALDSEADAAVAEAFASALATFAKSGECGGLVELPCTCQA